jgi:hypothetical protein
MAYERADWPALKLLWLAGAGRCRDYAIVKDRGRGERQIEDKPRALVSVRFEGRNPVKREAPIPVYRTGKSASVVWRLFSLGYSL